jgi:DNA-binding NarL/FixJ family response regulator
MNTINSNLLSDTLNLVQLARETARLKGNSNKAERLEPVVQQLQSIVSGEKSSKPTSQGVMGQSDFQTLLSVAQDRQNYQPKENLDDRRRMVGALAGGGMNDVEIARQMGMTRDEVRMIINLGNIGSRR